LYHFAGKLEMIVMQLLVTQFCRFGQAAAAAASSSSGSGAAAAAAAVHVLSGTRHLCVFMFTL